MPEFPRTRMRRLRMKPFTRALVRETKLLPNDLIWPLIVSDSANPVSPIDAMPGVDRLNLDYAVDSATYAGELSIPAVAVFPHVQDKHKSGDGAEAYNDDGLIQETIREMKQAAPNTGVIADVALDPYTTHGHDGVLNARGEVDNDATVERLCQAAVSLAKAGADMIAPSDMMDGRVGAIRRALDAAGYPMLPILAYTAKYASAFYGPFREAIGARTAHERHTQPPIDKSTYQMDPGNVKEAIKEAEMDMEEGADILMVKPGLPYLDVIQALVDDGETPVFAFQVSGEYAMIEAAAREGWIDREKAIFESLRCLRRAGASAIFTYYAREVAEIMLPVRKRDPRPAPKLIRREAPQRIKAVKGRK